MGLKHVVPEKLRSALQVRTQRTLAPRPGPIALALPVLDVTGAFIGMVTSADIVRLDEILGTGDEPTA